MSNEIDGGGGDPRVEYPGQPEPTGILCLGRYQGEEIVVFLPDGQEFSIFVTSFFHGGSKNGRGVRLGIKAPKNLGIYRREILDEIKKEGRRKEG